MIADGGTVSDPLVLTKGGTGQLDFTSTAEYVYGGVNVNGGIVNVDNAAAAVADAALRQRRHGYGCLGGHVGVKSG